MQSNSRVVLAALTAASMLCAVAPSASFAQALPARIKIGSSQPLSGSGAGSGLAAKIVQEMAVKEVNAAGGMAGRPVDIVFGDDGADPTRAVTEAKRLIDQEKVHVLIGPGIAAVDATKSVEGPKLAAWLEQNGGSVKAVMGKLTMSKTDHFMYHSDVFAFTVRPDQVNAQGVAQREGC